jgi:hypothetical protein
MPALVSIKNFWRLVACSGVLVYEDAHSGESEKTEDYEILVSVEEKTGESGNDDDDGGDEEEEDGKSMDFVHNSNPVEGNVKYVSYIDILYILWEMPSYLILNTQTMHITSIFHNSTAVFPKKILHPGGIQTRISNSRGGAYIST